MNCRMMTTLMRNGRDRRSGKPVMGHAILERALLVGTRSADHIRASGHSGCIATGRASTRKNRPDTWLHPNASQIGQILLAPRAPFHDISLRCAIWSLSGHCGLWPAERPVYLWVHGLALLWQIFNGTGFPNQFFNDSWVVGFWRADHGRRNVELGRQASRMAQAVLGSPGP